MMMYLDDFLFVFVSCLEVVFCFYLVEGIWFLMILSSCKVIDLKFVVILFLLVVVMFLLSNELISIFDEVFFCLLFKFGKYCVFLFLVLVVV